MKTMRVVSTLKIIQMLWLPCQLAATKDCLQEYSSGGQEDARQEFHEKACLRP